MKKMLFALLAIAFALPVNAQWGGIYNSRSVPIAGIGGLGTGVATALGTNVGSAGSPVVNGGALGTPSSGVGTNITGVNAATLGGATFAAPGPIGSGTPGTGAFTSVGATGIISTTAVKTSVLSAAAAAAAYTELAAQGAATSLYIGMDGSAGGTFGSVGNYGTVIWRPAATQFEISRAGTRDFHISGAGAVIISNLSTATGTPNSICQNSSTKEIVVNAALTCTVSSARFKNHIERFSGSGLRLVSAIDPSTFFYNDRPARRRIGMIAENLATVDPRLAEMDSDGRPNSIDFPAVMGVLVKAVQEQQAQIKTLEAQISKLRKASSLSRMIPRPAYN